MDKAGRKSLSTESGMRLRGLFSGLVVFGVTLGPLGINVFSLGVGPLVEVNLSPQQDSALHSNESGSVQSFADMLKRLERKGW